MAYLHGGISDDVFRPFAFYSGVVLTKTVAMSLLTTAVRMKYRAFDNPEDAARRKVTPVSHERVERVRRNHMNDLENVLPFVLIGCVYVHTKPNAKTALRCFRLFAVSRLVHTLAYQASIGPPTRSMAFLAGFGVCGFMLVKILTHFKDAM